MEGFYQNGKRSRFAGSAYIVLGEAQRFREDAVKHQSVRAKIRRTEGQRQTKTYLRKRPDGTEDWVTDPKDATGDYRKPIEVTQVRLAILGVLGTTLVEVPDANQMQSKYIICRQEQTRPS
jgi:hypothetical protein